jgi:hypothetical protein
MTLLNNARIINSPKQVLKMLIARKHKTVFDTVAIATSAHLPVCLNRNVAYGASCKTRKRNCVIDFKAA